MCLLVKEAGCETRCMSYVGVSSSACGYLSDSVKSLIFSLVNEQGHEVSELLEGIFPGGECSDLFLGACPRV